MDARGWEGTEALERHGLLLRMTFAVETRNRRYADQILVEATRWLKRHDDGEDPVIREAQELLRAEFPRSTRPLRAAAALLMPLFSGVRGRVVLRTSPAQRGSEGTRHRV
jgi:hypothetical protein